jgi:hypothetical protein
LLGSIDGSQARTEAIAKKEAELAEQRTAFMADIAAKKRLAFLLQ